MNREEIIDCLTNPEFDMEWNGDKGKEFRKAVIDLLEKQKLETAKLLNPYGEYLCKFAENHGMTIEQARIHPTVKARYEIFNKTGL